LEAGTAFTLFVRITNPYDVPVTILHVGTQLPVEFLNPDLDQLGLLASIKKRIKGVFVGGSINRSTFTFSSTGGLVGSAPADHSPRSEELLQPGNASEKMSKIVTSRKTFFVPATYNFHIQITYEMDGKINEDAIKQQFSIRAPLSAIIWGSVWGAIVGSVLRLLNPSAGSRPPDGRFFADLVGGILLAAVMVVAFARKKDVQPFISVEDFWGGFFVGVVAAYGGKTVVDQFLGTPAVGKTELPAPTLLRVHGGPNVSFHSA
jgi:hypothetical protein